MSTQRNHQQGSGPTPSIREIADLTARLRTLTAAGRAVDPAERAAFLTDKTALLDGIPHPDGSGGAR
ncbi:hypothetical protein [Pseudonocardia adelaidensis]|uniref:Uncharacterized protein n=1 Tax=Pseudonocardia adelaidensis TaxID=648754 RepID=A0ABP9NPZ6_9PSEU